MVYTITFHWATNYGAVLQAYALQRFLCRNDYETCIIDYVPRNQEKTFLRAFRARSVYKLFQQLREFRKEKKIQKFREKELKLTRRYRSSDELKSELWNNDIYICGSDQIWNSFFTMQGEGKITTVYYLDFVPYDAKKIAYAGSFGVERITNEMQNVISSQLRGFSTVTVREQSAVSILEKAGIDSTLVCDPVFLLDKQDYLPFIASVNRSSSKCIFKYILHQDQELAYNVCNYVSKKLGNTFVSHIDTMGVEEWISKLSYAEFVVTNSFHAIAFSILFHRPFIAVLIPQSGMNDRINTLLNRVGLRNRMVDRYDCELLNGLMESQIDWNTVDRLVEDMRNQSQAVLLDAISGGKKHVD